MSKKDKKGVWNVAYFVEKKRKEECYGKGCRIVEWCVLQYVVNTRKNGRYKAKKGRKNGHLEKVLRKSRITNNKYQLKININNVSRETLPVSKIEKYNTLL